MLLVGWELVVAANCCCWLLILVAAVDCCCWLLLLIAAAGCCCWLLLLVAAVDCCCWLLLLVAAVDCCCWLLLLIAAAQKVFEFFRDIVDDLRLRQFCRRKSLGIFPGCWWKVFEYFQNIDEREVGERFASGKQAKKRMNILAVSWLFILYISRWPPVEREPIGSFAEKWRAGRLAL